MRAILRYSSCFDGEYYKNNGIICSFANKQSAEKICKVLNDFVNINCKEFCKKQFKTEDIYSNDYIFNKFLKESVIEKELRKTLLEILDSDNVEKLIEILKKEAGYIYIEEETFTIEYIPEFLIL